MKRQKKRVDEKVGQGEVRCSAVSGLDSEVIAIGGPYEDLSELPNQISLQHINNTSTIDSLHSIRN